MRLKAYSDTAVLAVGADSQCRATYAWITGPDQKWQRDRSRVKNIWYRSPDDLDEVHAPGGRKSRPCGDSLVQKRSKVLSLNADDDQFVAVGTRRGCNGAVVRRFDSSGNGVGTKVNCRSKVKTTTGATVVSARYQQVWLWSGDKVSSD